MAIFGQTNELTIESTNRNLYHLAMLVICLLPVAKCDQATSPEEIHLSSSLNRSSTFNRHNVHRNKWNSWQDAFIFTDKHQASLARPLSATSSRKRNSERARYHSSSQTHPKRGKVDLKIGIEPNIDKNTQTRMSSSQQTRKRQHNHQRRTQAETERRPNIIFMLTDDQDISLGSMDYMPKTTKILARGGVHAKNAFVTTPMCCPSRSSILTGLYVHNHHVHTNGENCSSTQWQKTHERRTFATYLRDSGYRTAFFGKYLNEYNGSYIPPGWSDWSALIRNSRYYNYTLNVNGDKVWHGENYELDYYPDLILNDSLHFIRYSKRFFPRKPYLLVLSFPSPHGPEDSAPQYQNLFLNERSHRTPSWDYAPNEDKQWLLRKTNRMNPIQQKFTDILHTKRLQTLQSVDDAVHQIYHEMKKLGELENTYIIYTSDHGYHLGQFGLVKGKAMPFEFDVRVPFFIAGPGIPRDRTLIPIVLNIDIAPTILDLANLPIPSHIDGVSILPYIKELDSGMLKSDKIIDTKKQKFRRDSFLIEKFSKKFKQLSQLNPVDRLLIPIIGKRQWLSLQCQKEEYKSPCKAQQKFECLQNENRIYRLRKCHRPRRKHGHGSNHCDCGELSRTSMEMSNITTRGEHRIKTRRRTRRDERHFGARSMPFDVSAVLELQKMIYLHHGANGPFDSNRIDKTVGVDNWNEVSNITTSQLVSLLSSEDWSEFSNYTDYQNRTLCTVARSNLSIECSEKIYDDHRFWRKSKHHVDRIIRQLQRRLLELKGIRRHMNEKRPKGAIRDNEHCHCNNVDRQPITPMIESATTKDLSFRQQSLSRHENIDRKKWWKKKEKRLRRKEKFENTACELAANEQMNCFTHGNEHWKTPPMWIDGPFCFCQNSLNNSFWCLRTINETSNFLFCEFVTGFLLYFDLNKDPFQLRNAIFDLEFSTLEALNRELLTLKNCSGATYCSHAQNYSRSNKPICQNLNCSKEELARGLEAKPNT